MSVVNKTPAAGVRRGVITGADILAVRSPPFTITCFTSSPEQNPPSAPVIAMQQALLVANAAAKSAYVTCVRGFLVWSRFNAMTSKHPSRSLSISPHSFFTSTPDDDPRNP
jgi:hypothetical protein